MGGGVGVFVVKGCCIIVRQVGNSCLLIMYVPVLGCVFGDLETAPNQVCVRHSIRSSHPLEKFRLY